jgi:hypothetical protein
MSVVLAHLFIIDLFDRDIGDCGVVEKSEKEEVSI